MALITLGANGLPTGSVLQVVQNQFSSSTEQTTSGTYVASAMHLTIQKLKNNSKCLVMETGAHSYLTAYANGCISTICQESSSSTFTASTTYNADNDPASGFTFGMQQVYNSTTLNTAPHSKMWLFDSSGNEFEAFRAFFKARIATRNAVFYELNHKMTLTIMEIAQ